MDIDELKRINDMTKELQKHGIAENSQEGSKMAGDMNDNELPLKDATASENVDTDVSLLMERLERKLRHEIEALHEKVGQIESHVKALQARPEPKAPAAPTPAPTPPPAPVAAAPEPEKTKSVGDGRADPDNVDIESVSVEKIFYYGDKK